MGRWAQGQQTVEQLLRDRHLQQVVADADTVTALLQAASRHIATATAAVDGDPEGAYSLAYDAARKSATAVLAHQGLRPTSAGGHIAVVETIHAQFPKVPGLASLDRLRRHRNQPEYPQPGHTTPSTLMRPPRPPPSRAIASPARGGCLNLINSGSSDEDPGGRG